MPEVYTELTAPTAVSHSLTIHFTSATAENLIVARTSLLQIFSTTTHETELPPSNGTSSSDPANKEKEGGIDRRALDADEEGTFAADIALQRSQVQTVTKLVLVAEYNLCGSVTGMQRIRLLASKSGGEALLLSFKDAKLSLLEWDPSTNAVTTISLHYYEREEFWPSVVSEGLSTTLVADPGSRCAALNFAGDMIAILPFRQREDEDLSLGNVDGAGHDLHMAEGEDDDWDPSAPEKKPEDDLDSEMAGTTDKTKEDAMAAKLIAADRPYYPSFVLPVSRLDDAISHVISLTFLHEYRGPTFGILYSPRRTWAGLLAAEGRKDTISYIVITLDLEQRASTPILSVSGLPYDIFKVVALAPPIGGSLLIGGNEIIHLDQAGKTTGVAVNPYTKRSTTFAGLADQSDLCLELEGSSVVELEGENGDILLITKKGEAVIIGFKTDGRNVSGVKITRLANHPTSLVGGRVSTLVALGSRRLFVGCTEGDARLLKWKRKGEKKKPGESLKEEVAENEDEEDVYKMLEDMDDDLYGGGDSSYKKTERKDGGVKPMGEYIFSTHDRLLNLGPFRDIVLGRPTFTPDSVSRQVGVTPELELVTTAGPINTPEDAGVSVLRKSIAPTVVGKLDFPSCQALWTVRARSGKTAVNSALAGLTSGEEDQGGAEEEFDGFLFVSKSEESQVFRVGDTFEEVRGTDFESEGETLEVGVVGGGMRVVQVVSEQVRVYDCDLQLAQIIPMFNEDTGEEGPNVLRARVYDPYVLLVRIDGSVVIYRVHKGNLELVEEERGDRLKSSKYSSGCIYAAKKGEFHPVAAVPGGESEGKKKSQEEEEEGGETEYVLFLITFEGCLQVYSLANLAEPIFVSEGFSSLPPLLRADDTIGPTTSHSHREKNVKENIVEILVTDLGDQVAKEPFMIVRSARDDLTFYKPFVCPGTSESKPTLRFSKSPNPHLALPINPMKSSSSKTIFRPLVSIQNLAGYTCVFLPGADPSFVLKTSKSIPHVHRLAGNAVRSLAAFHSSGADRGFVYVDNFGIVRVSLMPTEFNFDGNWGARKITVGDVVQALSYFPPMGVYVVSTTQLVPFDLAEDDGSVAKDKTTLQPEVESGAIKILSPLNWSVVDQFKFAHNEIALVVKTIEMEISEHTKERKQLVAVGTGIFKGEDHSARGGIYVFEIIEVVPEPGKPETNCKLKLVCREEVKGTVSAICGVNGYLLAAQGQKIMVRGLKEDQSLLPVAFMDMSMYVTVAKNLDGMILFGDFMKSIWFTGFSEEPYKMTLFGKDTQTLEVVAADFLPDGNKLYFVVADADSNIHVLQYDPEHPKSLAGQRLIRRADFFAGHEVKTLTMLPRSRPIASDSDPDAMDTVTDTPEEFLVLAGTLTGSLAMITTLPETSYRRLNIVQGQIVSGEEHTAGLNPRGYRAVASSGAAGVGGDLLRGVLDGALVRRWIGFGEGRKSEIASKAGNDIQGIREDLKGLEGALLYL